MMDKTDLKKKVVKMQERIVEQLEQQIETMRAAADLDEDNTLNSEDYSHQDEYGEMMQHISEQSRGERNLLDAIKALPVDAMDKVHPGALVETDNFTFFVSIHTHPFEWEGLHVIGLPTDAPLYSLLRDKSVGDTIEYADNEYTIKAIH